MNIEILLSIIAYVLISYRIMSNYSLPIYNRYTGKRMRKAEMLIFVLSPITLPLVLIIGYVILIRGK